MDGPRSREDARIPLANRIAADHVHIYTTTCAVEEAWYHWTSIYCIPTTLCSILCKIMRYACNVDVPSLHRHALTYLLHEN